ncbi:MAG: hypothetical protein PWP31_95 [Clostridia bacterium]|nr:hypothetical protein [Clostridia bacterium]
MRLGLALGGGGLKGAAHIGVLRVLEDNGIKPDIIVGTSAGSIAAVLYGIGLIPDDNPLSIMPLSALNLQNRRSVRGLPLGLLNGNAVEMMLKKVLKNRKFSDLSPQIATVACDLTTGETIIYTDGKPTQDLPAYMVMGGDVPVCEAVRASISVPGLFSPYTIGSRLLVDGGLTDNVPADVCRFLGADVVIAVDLGYGIPNRNFDHVGEVIIQSIEIISQRNIALTLNLYANLILRPIKKPVSSWDPTKFTELIAWGKEETQHNMDQIHRLLGK